MKATKKIVGATAALVAAVALSAGSTFAWFATNSTVTANGMQVTVDSTQSYLLITSGNTAFSGTSDTTETLTSYSTAIKPCTHDWNVGVDTGLKYVNNPDQVDGSSGLQSGDTELTYTAVEKADDNNSTYYYDYVIYLGAWEQSISDKSLKMTLSPVEGTASGTYAAVSVDFYVGSTISKDTCTGTLNLIGYNHDNSAPGTANVTSVTTTSTVNIPEVTANAASTSGLKVTMRTYIDGALLSGEGQAFVNSTSVSTASIQFKVQFELV